MESNILTSKMYSIEVTKTIADSIELVNRLESVTLTCFHLLLSIYNNYPEVFHKELGELGICLVFLKEKSRGVPFSITEEPSNDVVEVLNKSISTASKFDDKHVTIDILCQSIKQFIIKNRLPEDDIVYVLVGNPYTAVDIQEFELIGKDLPHSAVEKIKEQVLPRDRIDEIKKAIEQQRLRYSLDRTRTRLPVDYENGKSFKRTVVTKPGIPHSSSQKTAHSSDDARAKTSSDRYIPSKKVLEYCTDLTMQATEGKLEPLVGREKELDRVAQILCRKTKRNAILLGDSGVGKTTIVEGLAQRIVNGEVPDRLKGVTILSLNLTAMAAGTALRGSLEAKINSLIEELAKNRGKVVLFIDEIHNIQRIGETMGTPPISEVLKPSLARGEITVIGATTPDSYKKGIALDGALKRRFQEVLIDELSIEDSVKIISKVKERYEEYHGLKISDKAIKYAVTMSDRYINNRSLPDKAIDIIDEAASKVQLIVPSDKLQSYVIDEMDIKKTLEQMTGVRTYISGKEELIAFLSLGDNLKKRVIGQDEAISLLVKTIKRNKVGLSDGERPLGSFLFVGQTGVGKTYLAKELGRELFGYNSKILKLDMSEYRESHSISKLIGSPPGYVGYGDKSQLSDWIKQNPNSIVVFDEVEKAHPEVLNILLQILEDGSLTDSMGSRVNFKNSIIIMTTNVGATEFFKKSSSIGFANSKESRGVQLIDGVTKCLKDSFSPELLNRMDEKIIFNQLGDEQLKSIAKIMLNNMAERLADNGVTLTFTEDVSGFVVSKLTSQDREYGARPLRKILRDTVEEVVADVILTKQVEDAGSIELQVYVDENGDVQIRDVKPTDGYDVTELAITSPNSSTAN